MAKKRSKLSKSTVEAGVSLDARLPLFNEEALSALTARIEKGLDSSKMERHLTPSNKTIELEGKDTIGNRLKGASNSKRSESRRGTKRDANGNAKTSSRKDSNPPTQNARAADGNAALLQEILALGGTKEDLELVADVQSDEEGVSNNGLSLSKSLRKELANFIAGLGIENRTSSHEDESIEDEEDWEEESTSNISQHLVTETIENARREQAPITQKTVAASDNVNRLVSNSKRAVLPQTDSL